LKNISQQVSVLADKIHDMRASRDRVLVAMAGAPGSGKSTLADEVARRLNAQKCPTLVVPMDGFHLDNAILEHRGLLTKKGAPETFDGEGFLIMIKRLHARMDVIVPTFDRNRDLSIAGAVHIPADVPVIIVEGNYLMFDEDPWHDLTSIWDLTVRLDVPMEELRGRLIQRWLNQNLSRAAATRRAESNDIPNAKRIIAKALSCDITL
jgi:pantothenate kinase